MITGTDNRCTDNRVIDQSSSYISIMSSTEEATLSSIVAEGSHETAEKCIAEDKKCEEFIEEEAFVVTALYQFVAIPEDEIDPLRAHIKNFCQQTGTIGSILVATEGLNGTVCTPRQFAQHFRELLFQVPFVDPNIIKLRTSYTPRPIFDRLRIRHKKEIVTMKIPDFIGSCDINKERGIYVPPQQWNQIISDPNVLVVDTRNDYEVKIGSFHRAVNPCTDSFGEFPKWMDEYIQQQQNTVDGVVPTKIAMFCTGGIRCEKSTSFVSSQMKPKYFQEVYHLEGGILNYLESIPPANSLWKGECFVFDQRIAVGHDLKATGTYMICVECRKRLSTPNGHLCELCYSQSTNIHVKVNEQLDQNANNNEFHEMHAEAP